MNNNKYIIIGVGDYDISHSDKDAKVTIKLDVMQEDKIIHSKNGNFLVMRHATFTIDDYHKLQSIVGKGLTIESRHLCVLVDELGEKQHDFLGRYEDCKLVYILMEQSVDCVGLFKLVFEFGESTNEIKNK